MMPAGVRPIFSLEDIFDGELLPAFPFPIHDSQGIEGDIVRASLPQFHEVGTPRRRHFDDLDLITIVNAFFYVGSSLPHLGVHVVNNNKVISIPESSFGPIDSPPIRLSELTPFEHEFSILPFKEIIGAQDARGVSV